MLKLKVLRIRSFMTPSLMKNYKDSSMTTLLLVFRRTFIISEFFQYFFTWYQSIVSKFRWIYILFFFFSFFSDTPINRSLMSNSATWCRPKKACTYPSLYLKWYKPGKTKFILDNVIRKTDRRVPSFPSRIIFLTFRISSELASFASYFLIPRISPYFPPYFPSRNIATN